MGRKELRECCVWNVTPNWWDWSSEPGFIMRNKLSLIPEESLKGWEDDTVSNVYKVKWEQVTWRCCTMLRFCSAGLIWHLQNMGGKKPQLFTQNKQNIISFHSDVTTVFCNQTPCVSDPLLDISCQGCLLIFSTEKKPLKETDKVIK